MMFSPFLLLFAIVLLAVHALRRALISPLNKIPGPWYARFTTLVLKWHEFRANRTGYVHAMHLKYGPTVRIAPNEVVFASASAVKEIYCSGGSGYDKTDFYDMFKIYGRRYGIGPKPMWKGAEAGAGADRCLPVRTMFTTLNKDDVSRSFPLDPQICQVGR